MNVFYTGTSSQ